MKTTFSFRLLTLLLVLMIPFIAWCLSGCSESSSSHNGIADHGIIEAPEIVPLPNITDKARIVLRGKTYKGFGVQVQGGAIEAKTTADPYTGAFKLSVDLGLGENHLQIYAMLREAKSDPAEASVIRVDTQNLTLDTIEPGTGHAGSILAISGNGFSADKEKMGVYFKGLELESAGIVKESTETTMQVAVPFVFLKSDEIVQMYVYN